MDLDSPLFFMIVIVFAIIVYVLGTKMERVPEKYKTLVISTNGAVIALFFLWVWNSYQGWMGR